MQVVTVSGYKGGTGKTTVATLLAVAAMQKGLKVAVLDLDPTTRNLANIVRLRRESNLPAPDSVALLDGKNPKTGKESGRLGTLLRMVQMDGYDLLVIDSSSGDRTDIYEAHLFSDAVVTPMNESPADLHALFTPPGDPSAPKINYQELLDTVRFDRKRAKMAPQRWMICLNRCSVLPTKVGGSVREDLAQMAAKAGYDALLEVRDRVAHRSISQSGRTVLDPPPEGTQLTMSELGGRQEARALLTIIETLTPARAAA
jgi:cellulose biosynthesis protein BcsQ